ncbi:hypothetical protein E4T66_03985 [Sinimarinibacterium sp. CAU 1509]|uniref:hypothetical protein n=1 Tax=Sinimarinibacterium sp. CAU 1509 TaxID=2562283 RepID=UPI0010AD25FB|nr:hypothetical protein [Sinimarinibacterium sp. CAU 1509]TJY62888.1 hypothetical protein E4T66_03985 [Sinimarinibacterium sp. CAU 1509]
MRQVLSLTAVLVTTSLWTTGALAADAAECRTYDGQKWNSQGTTEIAPCMIAVDRSTEKYNNEGFKFGSWGSVLLSADQYYFYSSTDNGQNWISAGLKSDYLSHATPQPYSAPQRAEAGVPFESAPQRAEAVVPFEPAVVATPAPEAAAESGTAAPTTSYVAPAGATQSGNVNICTLKYGNSYQKVGTMSLDQCVTALLSSDMPPDRNGYTYAYWGNQFMVATPEKVQVSGETKGSWRTVLERR